MAPVPAAYPPSESIDGKFRLGFVEVNWTPEERRELAEAACVRSIGRLEVPLEHVGRGAGCEVLSGRLRLPGGGEVRVALKVTTLTSTEVNRAW